MITNGDMILAEGQYYSIDDYQTKRNNNILVVGSPGTGKTTSVVIPNLLQAYGSYIISDPKGQLYRQYARYFKGKGYSVKVLDFTHLEQSSHYNPFAYIHSTQDVIRMANSLVFQNDMASFSKDPFWDYATFLLYCAVIAYLAFECPERMRTIQNMANLILMCQIMDDNAHNNELDKIMQRLKAKKPESFAVRQYEKFRMSPCRTTQSILITAHSKLAAFDFPELNKMTAIDDLNLVEMGKRKTAIFVVVSDTDRSMDGISNLFFGQALQELCNYADNKCTNGRLPVSVRFILDDFATNVKIGEFPRIVSCIRSRGISAMMLIQSEAQLQAAYGDDGQTIISSADTYLYLGGNDLQTAQSVAMRGNLPLDKILSLPVGECIIFRRGSRPIQAKTFQLEEHRDYFPVIESRRMQKDKKPFSIFR